MTPERWQRLQDLFHAASELPPERRLTFADEASADDPELARELRALIDSADPADDLAVRLQQAAAALQQEVTLEVGERIGPYRVIEPLGEGGMGRVYLAARDDDAYRKRVAVKVATDVSSRDLMARFKSERQILASLEHPGIARLIDGGTTKAGVPYLVMEYAEGKPITTYCDERRLTIADRLRLFQAVCSTVHYAHQNLIVHRDLKPSNVLVTAEGEVKLLDFGIAKLLKPELSPEAAPVTRTALRPMTPEYASPEQIRGEPVTTASDVYSLGVVLYELLTGRRPFRMRGSSIRDVERQIAEAEPERPSAVAATPTGAPGEIGAVAAEDVARVRGTDPDRLRRQLRGDLDNIVMMALRKTPARRYASADQFAADVGRYLDGYPVLARKDTFLYRSGKFVARNRMGFLAASVFLVLLSAFAVNRWQLARELVHERDRARSEAEMARQGTSFLYDLFRVSEPADRKGRSAAVIESLDHAADRFETELREQPEVQATILDQIAAIYRGLGLPDRALPLREQALATRLRVLGDSNLETATSLQNLGDLQVERWELAAADPLLRRALAVREKLLGADDPAVAESVHGLAVARHAAGDWPDAERLYRRALQIRERRLGDGPETATTLIWLAQLVGPDEGRYAEAEPLVRRAVEIERNVWGQSHLDLARALDRLSDILEGEGNLEPAEAAARESLRIRRRMQGPDHPAQALSLLRLGRVREAQGELREAEALYRSVVGMTSRLFGDDSVEALRARGVLGALLVEERSYAEARTLLERAVLVGERLGETHPWTLRPRQHLAELAAAEGRFDEASRGFVEVLEARRKALPATSHEIGESLLSLGWLRMDRGDPNAAEPLLREGREILQSSAPNHWRVAQADSLYGSSLAALGRAAEAEPLLRHGYQRIAARQGSQRREAQAALGRLVRFYEARGDKEKEASFRRLMAGVRP
jgi:eukaryotic-like serine/threonine-protein kinase